MWETLALYGKYTAVSLRGQMQYRASFVMQLIGQLFATAIEFGAIVALFARFGTLRGWTLPEVALFYGLVGTAYALTEGIGRGLDTFGNVIKAGDFDRLLLRPRSTLFQVAAQEWQLMRLGRLMQALAVLLWAMTALPNVWTPGRVLFLAAVVVGGFCLFYGLFIVQATIAFWTVESLEIMNVLTYGGTETAQYPMTIYPTGFRRFFTFVVPLACLNFVPARVLLPYRHDLTTPLWLAWCAPLIGPLFLLCALQGWRVGVRHYRSTGS